MQVNRQEVYKMIIDRRKHEAHYESKKETYDAVMDDIFTPFTYHGGYPILFTEPGYCLCHKCARKDFEMHEDTELCSDIYYEGPDMHCDECGTVLPSAYGDPWSEENDPDLSPYDQHNVSFLIG